MELLFVIYFILNVEINWIESVELSRVPTTCHGPTIPNISDSFLRSNISYKTRRPSSTVPTRKPWYRPKTCDMPPAIGPCTNMIKVFVYDNATATCEEFDYGGCQGNGNRFPTKDACMDYCVSGDTARVTHPDRCKPTHAYGDCMASMDRWAYDRVFKTCKMFIYSGCGGNPNNFRTRERCEQECVLVTNKDIAELNYWRTGPERNSSDDSTNTTIEVETKESERMRIHAKIEIQNNNGSIVNFELNTNLDNKPNVSVNANVSNSPIISDSNNANDTTTVKVNDTML